MTAVFEGMDDVAKRALVQADGARVTPAEERWQLRDCCPAGAADRASALIVQGGLTRDAGRVEEGEERPISPEAENHNGRSLSRPMPL